MEINHKDIGTKLVTELSYDFMKNMKLEEYFTFSKGIFRWLLPYKQSGITKTDIFKIINEVSYTQSQLINIHPISDYGWKY